MATDDNTIKDSVFAYAEAGMRVIPLWGVDDCGVCLCRAGEECGRSAGKHPVSPGWEKSPRIKEEYMEAMFRNRNIGIATGKDSGVFVLDIDPENQGFESAKKWAEEYGSFFNSTARIKTGSGGYHLYYLLPDFEVRNSAGKLAAGIDIRGQGGQVVAPPSVSGKGAYTFDNAVEISPAPEWLLEKLRSKPINTKRVTIPQAVVEELGDAETARLRAYSEGAVANEMRRLAELTTMGWDRPWNITTFEVACNLIQLANAPWSHISIDDAHTIVFNETPARETGFDDEVVERTFKSAMTTVGDKATPVPDPPGNAADFMFGPEVTEDPKGPGVEVDNTIVVELEPLCYPSIDGNPIDGDTLDPDLARVRAAEELTRKYHSGHANSEYDESNSDLSELIDRPMSRSGDTSPIDEWVSGAIRTGTPALFWEALGYLLDGDDPLVTTVSIKGCGDILSLLATELRPAVDAGAPGLRFGPELKIMGAADLRIEFALTEIAFDLTEYLPAITHKALTAWGLAKARGHFGSATTTEVASRPSGDRKFGRRGVTQAGTSTDERGEGGEFFV